MKAELVDVNETRKNLTIEIPRDVVDAEIERVARDYSRKARIPGFRPGKAPARVIKQRFRDQILHDVAHELVPSAIDEAMRERGLEPVDTPDVRDVNVEEGSALTVHGVVRHRSGVRARRPLHHLPAPSARRHRRPGGVGRR
jgi:trigger factor